MKKKRRRSDKATAQRYHARQRALERYGLDLTDDDLEVLVRRVQAGTDVTLFDKQSHRVTTWIMNVRGITCRVVYDKTRKTIVSFLPLPPPNELPELTQAAN